MTKTWVAFASFLLLSGTAAMADGWGDSFKTLDTDGNGSISQTEWEAGWPKLKIDPVPTFRAMDSDTSSSLDEDEWTAAEKMVTAFPVSCKASTESWCPKQY